MTRGSNVNSRGITVSGRGVQVGTVVTGEVLAWETETDYANALDRHGTVYDEIADHAGGEANIAHSGYHYGSLVDGLVAYYPLDDSSTGTTAVDQTELGNDGSISGASYVGSGQVGGDSLSFDGTDDGVTVTHADVFDAKQFTVSFWAYPGDTGSLQEFSNKFATGDKHHIFRFDDPDSDGNNEVRFFVGENDGTDVVVDSTKEPAANTWVHICGVHNGDEAILYLDGVREASAATSTDGPAESSEDLGIGFDPTNNDFYYQGRIDDYRFYERALSPPEITALAARTVTSPVPTEATL